jgi:hypothetical protein
MLSAVYAEIHKKHIMLSVIMLNVVVPTHTQHALPSLLGQDKLNAKNSIEHNALDTIAGIQLS